MKIHRILVGIVLYGSMSLNASAQGLVLETAELEKRIEALEAVLQYVTVVDGEINGVAGPHFIIEGANVHVRSGAGSTGEGCNGLNATDPNCGNRSGLGNLIIGYNEPRPAAWDPENRCASDPDAKDPDHGDRSICTQRGGAHHLVVGQGNNFVGHGGVVLGLFNEAKGSHTTVTGGRENSASSRYSSVSGGVQNIASRPISSISGGYANRADGPVSSVLGGENNVAAGYASTVGAGLNNIASGAHSVVSGGIYSDAVGPGSAVSGGAGNKANGGHSSVSGGEYNEANNFASSVSGGSYNRANGERSSVSGGQGKVATGNDCVIGDSGIVC